MSNTDPDIGALIEELNNAGTAADTNPLVPTPIGVPKYQVGPTGEVMRDASGQPVPYSVGVMRDFDPSRVTSMIPAGTPGFAEPYQQPARYWTGDQWSLVNGMAVEDVYAVQRQLIDAGLLKPKGVIAGNWTNKEASSFWTVLANANNAGVTWDEMLSHMAATGRAAPPPPEEKVQRPQIELTKANPYAVAAVADGVSQRMRGRKMTDEERQRFLDFWAADEDRSNAEKAAIQTAEVNDTMPKTGENVLTSSGDREVDITQPNVKEGQVVPAVRTSHAPLTPEGAAQKFFEQNSAGEVGAHDIASQVENLLTILGTRFGGGVSGRPGA